MTSVTPEPSVLLLCAHYSCQWLLLTTSQGKHCHYTHFIDEETKASGEMTCPRSPKISISLDVELGPHKSSKLHYTTRSSRNTSEGSSPASLPDVSPTRQARLSACSADPPPRRRNCLLPAARSPSTAKPSFHLGTLPPAEFQVTTSTGRRKH